MSNGHGPVKASKPVDQQLRLELRPAIIIGEQGDPVYGDDNVASFTTDVTVKASMLQQTAYWLEVNWPLIVAIATALGGATLAVVTWVRKLRGGGNGQ
jgi:hypothetical protein